MKDHKIPPDKPRRAPIQYYPLSPPVHVYVHTNADKSHNKLIHCHGQYGLQVDRIMKWY